MLVSTLELHNKDKFKVFAYSFSKEKGFIINLDHPEAFNLDLPIKHLQSYTNIFVKEKTKALLYLPQFYTAQSCVLR